MVALITFEEIQRLKTESRRRDFLSSLSPEELQMQNSVIPIEKIRKMADAPLSEKRLKLIEEALKEFEEKDRLWDESLKNNESQK